MNNIFLFILFINKIKCQESIFFGCSAMPLPHIHIFTYSWLSCGYACTYVFFLQSQIQNKIILNKFCFVLFCFGLKHTHIDDFSSHLIVDAVHVCVQSSPIIIIIIENRAENIDIVVSCSWKFMKIILEKPI